MALRKNAKIELLKRAPLFAQCTRRELGELATIADEIDVRAGRVLTKQGSRGREFFVILEGTADVRRNGRKVRTLGPGDFFGEIALVVDRPRTATVTATSPVRLLVITDRSFRSLLERASGLQLKVLRALAERVAGDTL